MIHDILATANVIRHKHMLKQVPIKIFHVIASHPRRSVGAFLGILALGASMSALLLTAMPVRPSYVATNHRVNQPFVLKLGQKIKAIDTRSIRMTPAVDGSWRFVKQAGLSEDILVFTPTSYFVINTDYHVTLPGVTRYVLGSTSTPAVSFTTEKAPSLTKSGMITAAADKPVAADYLFVAELASPNRGLRQLELRTTPAVEMTKNIANDTRYEWRPKTLLPQGSSLEVEIFDAKNHVSLGKKTLQIAKEPTITSPRDRTRLVAGDTITLSFDQPIKSESSDKISFSTRGTGEWKSPSEYVFTPEKLAPGQMYTYTVASGLRTQDGGILTAEQSGSFSTLGAVVVTGSGPRGEGLAQAAQTISFTFDQPVDHSSAESRVSVSSGTITGKSWSGNTLRIGVTNLGFQNTVTATVAPGVVNAGFGLPSAQSFSTRFTTEVRSVRLSVPAYLQQHAATCSAASLRMVLAYRGIGSDEMGLVNAMGYAPRSMDKSTDPPTWDDPDQMFVGSVDGSIKAGTGAGPDAGPVAKAARAYGRNATPFTGIDAGWIASQIHAGNPVLMFGAFAATGNISWKTPSGSTETMNLTGHVTVVTGVKGEPSAPLGFWVNDPLRGAQYWTAAQVAANIARDPYRQAVVVF